MSTTYKSMQIILTHSKNIDKKLWDKAIDRSFNGNIFFTSWYLDIISVSKWKALLSSNYSLLLPIPAKNKLFHIGARLPIFFPYTTLLFKDPLHTKQNWEEIIIKSHKIKNLLSSPALYLKYFPAHTLLKKAPNVNYELDLPDALDLLRNHSLYQTFTKKTSAYGLYANTQIPLKGVKAFIDENMDSYQAKILKKIATESARRGRLMSIGVYNGKSRLASLSIALIFRNRVNIVANVTKKSLAAKDKKYYNFLTLKKLCDSYHNMNLTLEIPYYLDFFEDLPFVDIMRQIPLYTLRPNG